MVNLACGPYCASSSLMRLLAPVFVRCPTSSAICSLHCEDLFLRQDAKSAGHKVSYMGPCRRESKSQYGSSSVTSLHELWYNDMGEIREEAYRK